ncbi:MAG: serine hydrolase domain-containing protein [Pseudomonadales bacterium]|nr:serine hydrolase domain-containing protein [Pseudomonadales bacterium]
MSSSAAFAQNAISGQVLRPGTSNDMPRIRAEFQDFLDHNLLALSPGMAVAIVDIRGPSYINTSGVRTLGKSEPINAHTTFRLASLSKAFASATTGVLVKEGKLGWDSKLSHYLPNINFKDPLRQQQISIRNILSNSTGLFPHAYTNMLEDDVPYEKILPLFKKVDFVCDPGSCYTYQNVAYSFIGDVLQEVSGKQYSQLVQEKIFSPLQMNDASLSREAFVTNSNHASPHERRQRHLRATPVKQSYYSVAPAAGVNASISDMEQWLQALLGKKPEVLPQDLLSALFTSQATVKDRGFYRGQWRNVRSAGYGMGWRVFDYAGTQVIYHAGWVQGYHAEIVLIPSRGLGMALLMNSDHTAGIAAVPRFLDISLGLDHSLSLVSEPANH